MPQVRPIIQTFTAGEWSPLLDGRTDLQKYYSAAKTMENFRSLPFGPAERRPGVRFVREVKTSSAATYLIPFQFSTIQAYVIEAGNLYFRFYKDGAVIGAPVEVVTPYTTAQLPNVMFAQSADVLYLVHPDHAPRKLERTSDTAWTLTVIDFQPPATFEAPLDLNVTLTPAATSGNGVTFTAGSAVFLDSDVDREITFGTSRAIIRTLAGAAPNAAVTADIQSNFPDTNPIAAGEWTLDLSPATTLTPGAIGPLRAIITLTLTAGGWRAADVGKFVRISGGMVRITVFTSATVVSGEIMSALSTADAQGAGLWSLEVEDWTAARGFPVTVSFHENRLWFGGTAANPQTIWATIPELYEVLALGPNDADAIKYVLASNQVNAIRWFVSSRLLLIGTAGGELKVDSPNAAALTPSNASVRPATSHGATDIAPLNIGPAAVFVQDSRKQLRELVYRFDEDNYIAADLLLLAEHLTRDFDITRIAYQRSPRPYIWAIRSDGTLLGLSYDRAQDVVGWHRHTTEGSFEDVVVIPHPDGGRDQVWFVIKRVLTSGTVRLIEYFEETAGHYGAVNYDSASVYDGAAAGSISGLSHLEGETVGITADGAIYDDQVVSGGSVPLVVGSITTLTAVKIEAGLKYTSTLKTMRPEIPVQGGGIQGKRKGWNKVFVRLDATLGGKINNQQIHYRTVPDILGKPPALFTGDKAVQLLGMDRDGHIEFVQDQGLPATVVAIFGDMNVEG